jgi:enoyl-CoA hydratase
MRIMEMCLTGRVMDAAEAERAGLVSRVVAAEELLNDALATAGMIAAMSKPVAGMVAEAVDRAFEGGLSEGLLFERRLFHASSRPVIKRKG